VAEPVDLLVRDADLLVTCDNDRRELSGGWVAVDAGVVVALGDSGALPPTAREVRDAAGCLVTPGLINTHHHMFQNLTRAYGPTADRNLFGWLQALYPLWSRIDAEASYLATWIGMIELAAGGVTTTSDHLYIAPREGGDLWSAQIVAAREVGMRLHAGRGSMTLSTADGGLPPPSLVQDDDEVLADCERLIGAHHERTREAMVQVAIAPCALFNVGGELMAASAELAERLDVRLHAHLAEDPDEEAWCMQRYGRRPVDQFTEWGWLTDRTWIAHGIHPDPAEVRRLGAARVGVAHCPSSNMLLGGGGFCPVRELRSAGSPVGLGCDGSSSNDAASLWLEARTAMLVGRQRSGPGGMSARDVLEMATRDGAACLGRAGFLGELSPGSAGDLVVWPQQGPAFAGAGSDPVESWLRCGPTSVRDTVVAGRFLVRDGAPTHGAVDEMLRRHNTRARDLQRI
jgi:cytosine/adenosine deaminase-related metal-dependent hydrolase